MISWAILRRVRPWEVIVTLVAVGCIVYALASCASMNAAAEHGTQIGIGTGLGTGAGLLAGATGWGVLLAALVGSIGAILSTPGALPPGSPIPSAPSFSLLQYVIFGGILYVLWIRRARVMDGIRELRQSGSFKAARAHWSHAFLGTRRPGENR